MSAVFHLNIITPDKTVYDGAVTSLVAPGSTGYLGILANHRPIITKLMPGKVTLKDAGNGRRVFHSDGEGFLEVSNNKARLLLDSIRN